jgi:SAM-dependent methyltransferase
MEKADMVLATRWGAFIDRQHRYPTGLAGRLIGERMVRQHAPETAWSIELLDLRPHDRVLEIGSGAGRGLEIATQRVQAGLVVGLDLSATMLEAAARRNRATLRRQLALLRADISALPFGEQHFDKIYSIHTFYFWPDPYAVVVDLAHRLRSGGVLVATFATARRRASGEWDFWPLHAQAEALVQKLSRQPAITAALEHGPVSRQYNNVAIVVHKQ